MMQHFFLLSFLLFSFSFLLLFLSFLLSLMAEDQVIPENYTPHNIRQLLSPHLKLENDATLPDALVKLLGELLKRHPDKKKIQRASRPYVFSVGKSQKFPRSNCFHFKTIAGETEDFSYLKCINNWLFTKGTQAPSEGKETEKFEISKDEINGTVFGLNTSIWVILCQEDKTSWLQFNPWDESMDPHESLVLLYQKNTLREEEKIALYNSVSPQTQLLIFKEEGKTLKADKAAHFEEILKNLKQLLLEDRKIIDLGEISSFHLVGDRLDVISQTISPTFFPNKGNELEKRVFSLLQEWPLIYGCLVVQGLEYDGSEKDFIIMRLRDRKTIDLEIKGSLGIGIQKEIEHGLMQANHFWGGQKDELPTRTTEGIAVLCVKICDEFKEDPRVFCLTDNKKSFFSFVENRLNHGKVMDQTRLNIFFNKAVSQLLFTNASKKVGSMENVVKSDFQNFKKLSDASQKVLNLAKEPKMDILVQGLAGTGKTMFGLVALRNYLKNNPGKKTLYIAHTLALTDWVRKEFHVESLSDGKVNENELLVYDFIIADEFQDYSQTLQTALLGFKKLWILCDPQQIAHSDPEIFKKMLSKREDNCYFLRQCLRSTKAIVDNIKDKKENKYDEASFGSGHYQLVTVNSVGNLIDKIRSITFHKNASWAILVSLSLPDFYLEFLKVACEQLGLHVSESNIPETEKVVVTTPKKFAGLEADGVLYVVKSGNSHPKHQREHDFAITRAKQVCVVIETSLDLKTEILPA